MSRTGHAVRVGLRRGWTEFVLSLRSPQDQGFYLVVAAGTLGYLWTQRAERVGDTGLYVPTFALPGIIGGLLAFGIIIGPAYSLAMEREDGTLLRMKAVPRGMVGYVAGQLLYQSLGIVPMLTALLVPAAILFDDVMPADLSGWLMMAGLLLLGILATMPIGIALGAVVPNVQKVSTWGMIPTIGLALASGILIPVQQLWGWVQTVVQLFPMYWLGLGMRAAFLPDEAVAAELGGSWRTGQTVAVLAAWAVAGAAAMPYVLRRMARRQSGSTVAAAREAAGQWIR
jgi:ABC-2 type transport system permease protein